MKKVLAFVVLLFVPLATFAGVCKTVKPINMDTYAEGIDPPTVTFIAFDFASHDCRVINGAGLDTRHSPWSTFKIPHTLIALETRAAKSAEERIEWDPKKFPAQAYWPDTWKQSHTLATAFQHSAVWYYQSLVPRIPSAEYKKWLGRFHYGNQTFTQGSQQFWLNGELKLSPREQIDFIACLVQYRCGIGAKTLGVFETIALQESAGDFFLYAKTGAGPRDLTNNDGAFEGWYVGYVKDKAGNALAAFAIFMQADSFSALHSYRKELTLKLLADVGYWKSS